MSRIVRATADRVSHPRAHVRAEVLDVGDTDAVQAFAAGLSARHGGVDIVFSNAAARLTPETPPAQLWGRSSTPTISAPRGCCAFGPIMRVDARLLVVASAFGSLRNLPKHLHASFDTDAMTLGDVDAVMLAWRDAVMDGRASDEGWPEWINVPSKVGQVAAARVLARQRRTADPRDRTLMVAVCPGLIDTAASRPWFNDMTTAQTPAQAAEAPLLLALEPTADQRLHGELAQFGEVIPWR